MKTKSPAAIRISTTDEVRKALVRAKEIYPTLSDPEIFKLGLAKIITEEKPVKRTDEKEEIMAMAAHSIGYDYLSDPAEDAYAERLLKKAKKR